jgi:hypothetical protein
MKKQFISIFIVCVIISGTGVAQQSQDLWQLEKMPSDLETQYALSSLPQRLRNEATVYLLDPTKGYYMARKGTNGFSVLIVRTQWELAEFLSDMYTSVSFDAEGAKTFIPVYFDVAAMRATGKFTPQQIRDTIVQRVKNGIYKAPSRTGISYMLCPISRTHRDDGFVNEVMPHYMFYAPGVDDKDIGGEWEYGRSTPFAVNSGNVFDREHSIFNLIILPAGESEKAKIIEDNKDLLQKLAAYKPYFKIDPNDMNEKKHHH